MKGEGDYIKARVYMTQELTRKRTFEILRDDMTILVACYDAMTAERKRAFWQLRTGRAERILYLLRWGGLELGRPIELVG